ncbi:MAG: vWA domain-containing protein [Chitinophagales bacterium]
MWNKFMSFKFANPEYLWAIPVIIILAILWFVFLRKQRFAKITLSSTAAIDNKTSFKGILLQTLPLLRLLSIIALIIAMARPQTFDSDEKVKTMGIDIVLSMDVSASMLAKDFKPNRMEAAKEVASNFIEARPNDRMGLVVFSGESFTQVPVTTDHLIVQEQLAKIKHGLLAQGTAIGMGIATGVNRLKNSDAKSKVIILMTDGVNNAGLIDPKLATEAANQFDVKIYTIGVGSKGKALMPIGMNPNGTFQYGYADGEIDEKLLKEVAKETGGKYYRATNKESLEEIYSEIDILEKTEIVSSQTVRKTEEFYPFAFFSLLFLLIEFVIRHLVIRRVS